MLHSCHWPVRGQAGLSVLLAAAATPDEASATAVGIAEESDRVDLLLELLHPHAMAETAPTANQNFFIDCKDRRPLWAPRLLS